MRAWKPGSRRRPPSASRWSRASNRGLPTPHSARALVANLKHHPEWDQILNPSAKEMPAADPAPVDAGFERGAAMKLKSMPAP